MNVPLDELGSRKALEHLLPIFWRAAVGGINDYFSKYQAVANVHRPTTMRNIMRDHIVDRLRTLLSERIDVVVDDKNQTTYFHCCSQFRILVKKSDEDGSVELSKTQASFDFQSNEGQYILDPSVIPDITNLYLSYVPNEEAPEEPSVYLICPNADGWYWRFEIMPPATDVLELNPDMQPSKGSGEEYVGNDLVRLPAEKKPEAE